MKNIHKIGKELFITSDEEIKEGVDQWYLDKVLNEPYNSGGAQYSSKQDVIILTTDQDLIKDGVQVIDDEFLEWFVKNPSCEYAEVEKYFHEVGDTFDYEIIIPQEEPKLTNVCIKCGVDLYYADNFACQEHPKNCKGIHLSEETLKERALKEEPKQYSKVLSENGNELFFDKDGYLLKEEPKQKTLEESWEDISKEFEIFYNKQNQLYRIENTPTYSFFIFLKENYTLPTKKITVR